MPPKLLHRFFKTIVLPACAYELATHASTKRGRTSLRREAGIMYRAMIATARNPAAGQGLTARHYHQASITRAVRHSRLRLQGHILRRPAGHPLRRALELDLGRKKVGRPCFTYNEAIQRDISLVPPPC